MGKTNGKTNEVQRTNQECCRNAASERSRRLRPPSLCTRSQEPIRIGSENRAGRDDGEFLLGGILTQLIESLEDQLEESENVIAIEQRRISKLNKRLEKLKQLREMQETSNN